MKSLRAAAAQTRPACALALTISLCFLTLVSCAQRGAREGAARPVEWARPVEGRPGLPNFHKVDDHLYRGAQPSEEGFRELKDLGIKTVVNLRTFHSDDEHCEKQGLDCVSIKAQAWDVEEEDVIAFLAVATDPQRQPVFVHCSHGADRTGAVIAAYRVVISGWTKEAAIEEMIYGGFGFHYSFKNLIEFIKDLDVDAIREGVETRRASRE